MSRLITLTGPSGVGKSTIVNTLISQYGEYFGDAIAFTSRRPREGEQAGRDYVFMNTSQINTLQRNGGIAALSEIHGNTYGHTKASIFEACKDGKIGVAISDRERVEQYKACATELKIQVTSILLLPPSKKELLRRLEERYEVNPKLRAGHKERWKTGEKELVKKGRKLGVYDHEIVNDTLEDTIKEFLRVMKIKI